ncbi:MAG: hypothetical protein QF841_02120 [Arenicellales bacterium]|nr:hypothetical protein [Arenicellales bacterium]
MHTPSLTRCSIALALGISMAGCSSSTTSGIELSAQRGDDTAAYAGTYSGTMSLTSTADVVGTDSSTDQRTEAVLLEVKRNGLVYLTILGVRIHGVVDNNGNWGVQASLRDFQSLVSEKNISRLQDAGCSLDTKAARVQGVVRPPAFSGDVGGVLKCKRAGVTMATLTTSGALTAPSSAVADDSKADTSTDDSADTSSDTSNDTVRHSNQYHHWNTNAWHGQGSALVMCSNVTNGMKWCKINGHSLLKHGSADKGRDVWTIYQQNLGGVIQCYRGGITWEFKVSSASGVHYGNCSS